MLIAVCWLLNERLLLLHFHCLFVAALDKIENFMKKGGVLVVVLCVDVLLRRRGGQVGRVRVRRGGGDGADQAGALSFPSLLHFSRRSLFSFSQTTHKLQETENPDASPEQKAVRKRVLEFLEKEFPDVDKDE